MATIGIFRKDGEGYAGTIQTLTFRARLTLEPNARKSGNTKAPDFRIFHILDGFTSEIGAAWKKTSKDSAEYLSLSVHDDPSLTEPINCRLVKTGAEQGYTLYWDRPRD